MNKKHIIMILSALAVILVVFAACGKKNKGTETTEPVVTVTDAAGQVYEQVTEIVSEVETVTNADGTPEIKSEVVSEVKTEVVTNQKGEQVTKADGTPEIKSEVVTEIVTEVVTELKTEVVTETKPYTPPETTAKKGETTKSGSGSGSGSGSVAPVTQVEMDTELYPTGKPVEVTTNAQGKPDSSSTRVAKVFSQAKEKNQFAMKINVAADEMAEYGGANTMTYSFYTKNNKMAVEMAVPGVPALSSLSSISTIRFIVDGNKTIVNFGTLGNYSTTMDEAADMGLDTKLFDEIAAEDMDYQGTTVVAKDGKHYYCETYTKDATTSKYYFTADDKLVRIEITENGEAPTIIDIVSYSYSVSDKEFEPKGKSMTEEDMEKLFGSLAS